MKCTHTLEHMGGQQHDNREEQVKLNNVQIRYGEDRRSLNIEKMSP